MHQIRPLQLSCRCGTLAFSVFWVWRFGSFSWLKESKICDLSREASYIQYLLILDLTE